MLHECLTGQPPYRGADAMAVLRQHIEEPVADPGRERPDLHPVLRELACDLMEKHLGRRPSDPAMLLRRVAAVRDLLARAGSGAGSAGAPARRMAADSSAADIARTTSLVPAVAAVASPPGLAHARLSIPGGARLHVWAGSALTIGRERAGDGGWHARTLLLPEAAHAAANHRLSGRHLAISLEAGRCLVEDLGSSWGTRLDGIHLRSREAVAAADGAVLELAGVLWIRVRLLAGGAVLLQRVDNATDLAYLLVAGSAGLAATLGDLGDGLVLDCRAGGLRAGDRPLRAGDGLELPGLRIHVHDLSADEES